MGAFVSNPKGMGKRMEESSFQEDVSFTESSDGSSGSKVHVKESYLLTRRGVSGFSALPIQIILEISRYFYNMHLRDLSDEIYVGIQRKNIGLPLILSREIYGYFKKDRFRKVFQIFSSFNMKSVRCNEKELEMCFILPRNVCHIQLPEPDNLVRVFRKKYVRTGYLKMETLKSVEFSNFTSMKESLSTISMCVEKSCKVERLKILMDSCGGGNPLEIIGKLDLKYLHLTYYEPRVPHHPSVSLSDFLPSLRHLHLSLKRQSGGPMENPHGPGHPHGETVEEEVGGSALPLACSIISFADLDNLVRLRLANFELGVGLCNDLFGLKNLKWLALSRCKIPTDAFPFFDECIWRAIFVYKCVFVGRTLDRLPSSSQGFPEKLETLQIVKCVDETLPRNTGVPYVAKLLRFFVGFVSFLFDRVCDIKSKCTPGQYQFSLVHGCFTVNVVPNVMLKTLFVSIIDSEAENDSSMRGENERYEAEMIPTFLLNRFSLTLVNTIVSIVSNFHRFAEYEKPLCINYIYQLIKSVAMRVSQGLDSSGSSVSLSDECDEPLESAVGSFLRLCGLPEIPSDRTLTECVNEFPDMEQGMRDFTDKITRFVTSDEEEEEGELYF